MRRIGAVVVTAVPGLFVALNIHELGGKICCVRLVMSGAVS
ncbi:hypothetical protein AB0M05_36145 [Streptomyces violaceusniger]